MLPIAAALIAASAVPLPGARVSTSIVLDGTAVLARERIVELRGLAEAALFLPLPEGGGLSLRLAERAGATDDARIVVARSTPRGVVERPARFSPSRDLRLWGGSVEGHPEAVAFLAEHEGFVAGFVRLGGLDAPRTLWISDGPRGLGGPILVVDPARVPADALPALEAFCHADLLEQPAPPMPGQGGVAGAASGCRELLLAIDTDVEYTANLFGGNEAAAAAYAIALTAATSEIYAADVDVRLRTGFVRLWVGDDPWNQSGIVDQLFQYRDWWVANESKIERDLGHMLSGRGLGGGVAWLPGICGDIYAFGLSANLGGFFPYPIQGNNGGNWDLIVYAHEIGHNVGSPHTHSYDPPLDGCGNGDCSEAASGTIMSYCHLCPGGLANMALSFHPGNRATIVATLDAAPCLPPPGETPAVALDDYAVAPAGFTATVDPLANDERANCESIELVSFDAVTAAGRPVTLLPGATPMLAVPIAADATGSDTFGYSIVDASGSSASATVTLEIVPIVAATPVAGDVPGVVATYFAVADMVQLPNFTTLVPYASDVVPSIDYPSTDDAFATSGRADDVAALFEGWVRVPTTGFWTFFVDSDDGSKLFVGDQLVVSNDGLHGMIEKSGVVGLAAGAHPIRVEFFERGGGAGCIARLAGPGFPKQTIPASMWSHGGAVGADLDGDGVVGPADLALLLGAWGSSGPLADLDGDGSVGPADLALLLGAWGTVG